MPRKLCWLFNRNKPKDKAGSQQISTNIEDNGLKLLYTGSDPQFDIVAVHGLNGHRERSWTASNGVNWLRDLLPADLPQTRIYTWGYNAPPGTTSLQEISERLISDLWEMRESTATHNHPVIFFAHSVGGSVVKSALLYSDSAQETSIHHLRSISLSTKGMFFIGTPELDSRLAGLQSFVSTFKGTDQEQSDSYKEASWLVDLLERFSSFGGSFRTVFVYERPNNASSAQSIPSPPHKLASCMAIDADHNHMNKFGSPLDVGYLRIKEYLLEMTENADEGSPWE
ncbi:hypothetical protein N7510_002245 [Penicillium lagena]|uniref:uncharacterized protein n=1 Tax=Penicillium lagena TaxID=94218 RepID=UPI002540C2BB|nr:uncharacterized protein N7510_002245 [Penicillium lagena]KAJ5625936.1 hypothetical protein N7510_002245 [Penicillium lagena]